MITFINEIANPAEAVDTDIHQVVKSMGIDGRIYSKFLHLGPGYGGSCFPKDTKALASFGKKYGVKMNLIESVIQTNEILRAGGKVQAHDPKAMDNFAKVFPDIIYCHTAYDAVRNADAVIIVNE